MKRYRVTRLAGIVVAAALISAAFCTPANAMGRMVRATGHYNANCNVFSNGTRTQRAEALVFASGYAAALNNSNVVGRSADEVDLLDRWREFNRRVVRYCTDKSNEYLYRKFLSDAAYAALEDMRGAICPSLQENSDCDNWAK
jgi:hypothetical protein